ncbi:MAG: DUF4012 domain-containing protein [Ktedonobacterales bacterium]
MDEELERQRRPSRSRREPQGGARSRPNSGPSGGGGLLSRYGGAARESDKPHGEESIEAPIPPQQENFVSHAPKYVPGGGPSSGRYSPSDSPAPDQRRAAPPTARGDLNSTPLNDRLRGAQESERPRGNAWQAFTGQARRLGDNIRRAAGGRDDESHEPRAGNWKATDFDADELETWDREDSAPFDVPEDPDASYADYPSRSGSRQDFTRNPSRGNGPSGSGRGQPPRNDDSRWRRSPRDWDDDEWDGAWETGTWDTGWAAGGQPSMEYARPGGESFGDSGFWSPGRDAPYDDDDPPRESALAESLNTLAQLGAVGVPLGRLARLRLLLRRRPAAAAMLAFFLLGFMLTCCAPLIPLLRLGYDAADAAHRVSALQGIFAGGSSALFNTANLKDAQTQVDGITHDLYEINGAFSVIGAPLAAVSPQIRNYRLLVRMGFDLTASADEGLNVAQTLLTPLAGGALSSDGAGISPADITQARAVLQDASSRIQDAIDAYHSLDVGALPAQLQPNSKYGKYLELLPTAQSALGEMSALLNFVPAMLGIGQPAYYLVVAMDRSELRPGGGFQGNFGYLVLDGGKQSKTHPLSLNDMYNLDTTYYTSNITDPSPGNCASSGPQPPLVYWWWPYRDIPACQLGWGVRDSNLSADFPTNARTAMEIAKQAGFGDTSIPANTQLQGEIAFTPVLIEDLLQVVAPKGLPMPQYHITVTAQNLQREIHEFQLGVAGPKNQPRKTFTHELSTALLAQIKTLHGAALKPVLTVAQQAIKDKDLQIYFSDPRAELILQQLGLASTINQGGGDGFFVVDTNDGGNKANTYVSEHQTDYVTLLPNGGAVHQLQISVTYAKDGPVYQTTGTVPEDYIDMQRTYLPGDATILGYSGFFPSHFYTPDSCNNPGASTQTEAVIADCSQAYYEFLHPITSSDVPGRTMVMGQVVVACGAAIPAIDTLETPAVLRLFRGTQYENTNYSNQNRGTTNCDYLSVTRTEHIYISWYTPNAFAIGAGGHGTYSELVEKQAGSSDFLNGVGDYLTVYVDTSHLTSHNPNIGNVVIGANGADPEAQWSALLSGKKPISGFNNIHLQDDTTVTYGF